MLAQPSMLLRLTCLFLVSPSLQFWSPEAQWCLRQLGPTVYRHGDLVLSGFFPLYYRQQEPEPTYLHFLNSPGSTVVAARWLWKNYQYVLAFYFAIQEINKDPHLLPNLTLGFQLYNTIASNQFTLWGVLHGLSGTMPICPNYSCQTQHSPVAIIAGTTSAFSEETQTLLELYRTPQLTYGPSDPVLSDRHRFPSLYQMANRDGALAQGILTLLLRFGWTWVALFVSDDMRGEWFLQELSGEMIRRGVCVALTVKLPTTRTMYVASDIAFMNRIPASNASVHILYGDVRALVHIDISGEFFLTLGKVWVMVCKRDLVIYETTHLLHSFHGGFSFSHHHEEIPGLQAFLCTVNPSHYPEDFYFSTLWLQTFHCSLAGSLCGEIGVCQPNVSLEFLPADMDMRTLSDASYSIYNAVHAVALALHGLLLRNVEMASSTATDWPVLLPWQLHPFLRKLQFVNSARSHISLDETRNPTVQYDIHNVVSFPTGLGLLVKVGEFSSMNSEEPVLLMHEEWIEWPIAFIEAPQSVCSQSCSPGFMKIPQEGRPVCCFMCVSCQDRDISNQTDAEQCIQCPEQEYPNTERTRCLPKLVTFLALEDSLGTALVCMVLSLALITAVVFGIFVKYQDTPIVKANNHTLSYILLISLLLCFLCSFLFIGRPNTATCLLRQIIFALMFTLAVSAVLAKTITVVLAFKAMKPGRTMRRLLVSGAPNAVIPICFLIQLTLCGIWLATSPPFVDTDAHSEHGHIIVLCNEGSITAFYCVLGFLGSLALGTFTVAFLARNLPDTFNEAKFLTFSMLVFCSVWVTFLPVYHSTKGKVMVAVEVFSILASGAGLLGCIFVPKCYIVLLKPERNSLQVLKATRSSRINRLTVSFSLKPASP